MITYRQLQTFLAVARAGSLTLAARELGASQPTVSLQLKALGETLAAALVERRGRGLRLTPAGEALQLYAGSVLEGLRALEQHVAALKGGETGSLAVGASATAGGYVLPSVLRRFRDRFPHIDVQLHVDNPEHLFQDLVANALDVVFSVGVRAPSGLTVERVCEEELVIVASPRHPLAGRRRVTPGELSREPLVTSLAGALFRELVESKLREAGVVPRVAVQARHPEAMKKLVENNMGYSLLFRPSVDAEIRQGQLVALKLEAGPIMGEMIVAFSPRPVLSPVVQQFVSFVRTELAAGRDHTGARRSRPLRTGRRTVVPRASR